MAVTMRVTGISELADALRAMGARIDAATPLALVAASSLVEGKAKANLSLLSHSRGTPTPSAPGQPPAKVDGTLRDNWEKTPPIQAGAGEWTCTLYPTTVYAAIQELGGVTGRGHATTLPARPYLRPAVEELLRSGALREAFARVWAEAIRA